MARPAVVVRADNLAGVRTQLNGARLDVIIDVPKTRNALSIDVLAQLAAAINNAPHQGARVIVLSGGSHVFSSGANLSENPTAAQSADAVSAVYNAIEDSPLPVIASVESYCLGLAAGVVAACDITVAADDTRFALPEARMGQAPTLAAIPLAARLRRGDLSWLLLTGMDVSGQRSHAIGLVDVSVVAEGLTATVESVVGHLLEGAPGALVACKRLARDLPGLNARDALDLATRVAAERAMSAEALEGALARAERRPPSWEAVRTPIEHNDVNLTKESHHVR